MKKHLYLLSIYTLLTACATQTSIQEQTFIQKIEPFHEQKVLQAEKINVNEVFAIDGIEVKKNNIFATDSRNNNQMLYQYSLPEFQCIYTGGSRGGAENEFQLPPFLLQEHFGKGLYFRIQSICYQKFYIRRQQPTNP